MSKGGARPGAGRPKGQANKRSKEIAERLEQLNLKMYLEEFIEFRVEIVTKRTAYDLKKN